MAYKVNNTKFPSGTWAASLHPLGNDYYSDDNGYEYYDDKDGTLMDMSTVDVFYDYNGNQVFTKSDVNKATSKGQSEGIAKAKEILAATKSKLKPLSIAIGVGAVIAGVAIFIILKKRKK